MMKKRWIAIMTATVMTTAAATTAFAQEQGSLGAETGGTIQVQAPSGDTQQIPQGQAPFGGNMQQGPQGQAPFGGNMQQGPQSQTPFGGNMQQGPQSQAPFGGNMQQGPTDTQNSQNTTDGQNNQNTTGDQNNQASKDRKVPGMKGAGRGRQSGKSSFDKYAADGTISQETLDAIKKYVEEKRSNLLSDLLNDGVITQEEYNLMTAAEEKTGSTDSGAEAPSAGADTGAPSVEAEAGAGAPSAGADTDTPAAGTGNLVIAEDSDTAA